MNMEEKVWLGYDINKLAVCIKYLEEAKKTLNDVDELSSIKIDRKKSSNERILDFLTRVKN